MCFEFEWEYYQRRAEEARKAMQEAKEKSRQAKPAVPGKPAETDTAREEGQPVPV
jgi:hypothetical protein